MQYCTACNKAIATIHILDLRNGSIHEEKHLCAGCADQSGLVQMQKSSPLKLGSAEVLDLIGGMKSSETKAKGHDTSCPACGLSVAEFKVRGRMGCPRCYEVFHSALIPVLERVHDATCHRGRSPGRGETPPVAPDILADLRQKLAAAIDQENYEEAARIRDEIREQDSVGEAGE